MDIMKGDLGEPQYPLFGHKVDKRFVVDQYAGEKNFRFQGLQELVEPARLEGRIAGVSCSLI